MSRRRSAPTIEAIVDAVPAGAAGLRPAAQFDGLRRAADLRPRARRERALSARPDRRARRAARGHGLSDDDIVIRMTGCPNGCARPYLAEIGLVGKGPGRYNLYLGAAFDVIAALEALRRGSASTTASSRRSIRCSPPTRRSASRRALRRVRHPRGLRGAAPATAATSTPTWERSAPHERSQRPARACAPPAPIAGSGAACSRRRTGIGRRHDLRRSRASGEFRAAVLEGRGARRNTGA